MLWFTSDQHFGDDDVRLAFGRKFSNIDDLNNEIVDQFNSCVQKGDSVVMVGDFANKRANVSKYRSRLKCKDIRYVLGNHDHPAEMAKHFGKNSIFQTKVVKFKKVEGNETRHYNIWVSHYPHAIWPSSHHGSLHVYGHCHAAREEWLDKLMPDRRSMDIGVDNAYRIFGKYRPFSVNEVMELIGNRIGHHDLAVEIAYRDAQPDEALARNKGRC